MRLVALVLATVLLAQARAQDQPVLDRARLILDELAAECATRPWWRGQMYLQKGITPRVQDLERLVGDRPALLEAEVRRQDRPLLHRAVLLTSLVRRVPVAARLLLTDLASGDDADPITAMALGHLYLDLGETDRLAALIQAEKSSEFLGLCVLPPSCWADRALLHLAYHVECLLLRSGKALDRAASTLIVSTGRTDGLRALQYWTMGSIELTETEVRAIHDDWQRWLDENGSRLVWSEDLERFVIRE